MCGLFMAFQNESARLKLVLELSYRTKLKEQTSTTQLNRKQTKSGKKIRCRLRRLRVKKLTLFFFQRLLKGLTSTSKGKRDSFLLHLGHFPPVCAIISSGGLSSAPS
jgi:hypothetical protein